jgi:hypothetical protein
MEDPIGKAIAEKLTKLHKQMATDDDLHHRLKNDKEKTLEDMGFTPQEISTFKLVKKELDSCSCSCAPNKGWGRGCLISNSDGAISDP